MDKKIVINQTAREVQIAILENNRLVEYFVEKPEHSGMVGDIYMGEVENVMHGIRAAFVDINYDLNAFLPFAEIGQTQQYFEEFLGKDEIAKGKVSLAAQPGLDALGNLVNLKTGDKILIQIIKEPFAKKGPRATTEISLPGRYAVLVPYRDFVGISRKIYNRKEQRRLREIILEGKKSDYGIIIRTAAIDVSKKDLIEDLKRLEINWRNVEKGIEENSGPKILFKEMKLISTLIREIMNEDLSEIVVNHRNLYRDLATYLKEITSKTSAKLTLFSSRKPIFSEYRINRVIDRIMHRRVPLPCGGYIVIEHTEALTTIDINSGKFVGKKSHEENSLLVNEESAITIAQQLRLRDIGGLIVIDFIDMQEEKSKESVYKIFKGEIHKDRARWAIQPISEFGLLEMTRQRIRKSLLFTVTDSCPTCRGTGRVMSKSQIVAQIELWFQSFRQTENDRRLTLRVHPDIASYIKFSNAGLIWRFRFRFLALIQMVSDPNILFDSFSVYSHKKKKEVTEDFNGK